MFSLGSRVGGIGGDEAVSQFCAIYIFPLCTVKKPPPARFLAAQLPEADNSLMGFCGIKVTGREQPRKAAPRRKAERRAGHGDGARALTEGGARGRRGRRGTGKRVVLFMKKMGAMQKHLGRRPEV